VANPGSALLERSAHLETLTAALDRARSGQGVFVLLGGEAGVGKTAVLRAFTAALEGTLWGACDPLFTPRPLGPFLDIAAGTGLRFEAGTKPHQVASTIMREAWAQRGIVIVLEDLHWADEATLDVVSLLARRIESVPALVIASYRDDGLGRTHPLRRLLGELHGSSAIQRVAVEPLSPAAVASLAPAGMDAAALHRATGGNPFFVTEAIAAGASGRTGDALPATVRDAVLARAAWLDDEAMAVLEAVSVALPQAELWLLDALAPNAAGAVQRCLQSGMLTSSGNAVTFRHDLARRAIAESLAPYRRVELHRRALKSLSTPPAGSIDPARLADHADAAGDGAAVLRYAPLAAEQASASGAQRESAAQYERALRFAGAEPPEVRATLLEGRSYACYLTDQTDESIASLEEAVECWRATGDDLRRGAALSQLSRRLWCGGRTPDGARAGREALNLLEQLPPGRELALAYSNLAQVALNDEQREDTFGWSRLALGLAESLNERSVVVHSLNNIGTMQLLHDRPEGWETLSRSLAMAEQDGLGEHVGRAFIHLGWAMTRTRAHQYGHWLDRGITVCEELGLEGWEAYVIAYRARYHLDRGDWEAAVVDAERVLRCIRTVPLLHILALTVLGVIKARRGEPDRWVPLDEAQALLYGQGELQYRVPVATARAEAAWLDGRPEVVARETHGVLQAAADRDAGWVIGELTWLRRLAGLDGAIAVAVEPYASALAGDVDDAAKRWAELGCPYDAALALVESTDEDQLRYALTEFQRLGAKAAAAVVARKLREHGVRGLPRGARPRTKDHPAGLTPREVEVLALLRDGASNAEIAGRLYVSEKTVHHHVSAILRKLGVSSRGQAAREATKRGLIAAS
jgi:DNA-binding CsgD family transcriptional regulator/tetratricopeptide (TPR) repeat protein